MQYSKQVLRSAQYYSKIMFTVCTCVFQMHRFDSISNQLYIIAHQ